MNKFSLLFLSLLLPFTGISRNKITLEADTTVKVTVQTIIGDGIDTFTRSVTIKNIDVNIDSIIQIFHFDDIDRLKFDSINKLNRIKIDSIQKVNRAKMEFNRLKMDSINKFNRIKIDSIQKVNRAKMEFNRLKMDSIQKVNMLKMHSNMLKMDSLDKLNEMFDMNIFKMNELDPVFQLINNVGHNVIKYEIDGTKVIIINNSGLDSILNNCMAKDIDSLVLMISDTTVVIP
jgi:hypothetical protein